MKNDNEENESVRTKKRRFILHIPPDFNFKGDPPHWVRQLFLEPLLDGWKREVVVRNTKAVTKRADIYYYAPDGVKFRSRREVGQYLQDRGITKYSPVFNFWFNGRILGQEFTPYEVVRCSQPTKKGKSSRGDPSEEEMIFDEEIEIDIGADAFFDPLVLSAIREPGEPVELPLIREDYEAGLLTSTPPADEEHSGMFLPSTIRRIMEECPSVTIPKKRKLSMPHTSKAIKTETADSEPSFCICGGVEYGQMVLCDNTRCAIGWYHFNCVNMRKSPLGAWYCPICSGSTSDVLNPAYGPQNDVRSGQ